MHGSAIRCVRSHQQNMQKTENIHNCENWKLKYKNVNFGNQVFCSNNNERELMII